jgi:hypothetical protein
VSIASLVEPAKDVVHSQDITLQMMCNSHRLLVVSERPQDNKLTESVA